VAGILLAYCFDLRDNVFYIVTGGLLITLIVGLLLKQKQLAVLIASIVIGFFVYTQASAPFSVYPNQNLHEFKALVDGEIIDLVRSYDSSHYRIRIKGKLDAKNMIPIKDVDLFVDIYGLDKYKIDLIPGSKIAAIVKARIPRKMTDSGFPERDYAVSIGISFYARAYANQFSVLSAPKGINYYKSIVRSTIKEKIHRLYSAQTAPIIIAMITGDKSEIPYETRQDFNLTGTAHLLAISGLHVGIIAFALNLFLGFIKRKYLKFILLTVLIIAFVFLTGMHASALRAGIMIILYYWLKLHQREFYLINSLAFLTVLLLIFSPQMIYSVGFHMSLAAVTGIGLFYSPARKNILSVLRHENMFTEFLSSSVAVTASATLGVAPIVAYHFGVLSMSSYLVNTVLVPLMCLGMIFAQISLVISFVNTNFAVYYAKAGDFLVDISLQINQYIAQFEFGYIKGESTILLSIILSLISAYVLTSDNTRKFLFRFVIGIATFSTLIFLIEQ
nr:ComEC/Rec2 family competence protein [Candidatus Kapabacteria bacterium]